MAETQTNLAKSYVPAEHESDIRARWEESGAFHAEATAEGEPYCILIPPPNVTAALHLGHAFNNSLQDILVRYHRMRGLNTLWMPGTDHAGIATQAVVEKRLAQEGKRRTAISREEFIALVQQWKDEYEATITEQLKVMGCSCDWERQRFTMDEMCAKAVREAFFRLFKDGLIYRGKRLVNWDPVSQTALADDEVEDETVQGAMYYLRYPLVHRSTNPDDPKDCQEVTWSELIARGYPALPEDSDHEDDDNAWITVATTRPETYLGDTAVAVNPKDPRAGALKGLCVQLPIVGRVIPIITDDYVVLPDANSSEAKAQYATGFLKVTPAHDPNDWTLGVNHHEEIATNSAGEVVINVMAPDASISDQHGWQREACNEDGKVFVGLSREAAREKVLAEFKARNLLENIRQYTHTVGHSYRSHVPIEPYLSDQWYVKVTDDRMKGEALRALDDEQYEGTKPNREHIAPGLPGVSEKTTKSAIRTPTPGKPGALSPDGDGAMRFYPARYAKTYQQWHENLRDWCISRQLWWGHRIPVWEVFLSQAAHDFHHDVARDPAIRQIEADFEALFAAIDVKCKATVTRPFEPGRYYLSINSIAADGILNELATYITIENDPNTSLWPEGSARPEPTQLPRALAALKVKDNEAAERIMLYQAFGQDPDVLDTWFSSGLWPLSTMGWPAPEDFPDTIGLLDTFNPTSVLCTAREIITLWVSRMTMFNRYFMADKRVPFKHVYIHAMIQDGHGQKMSKSLGNGVDPRDIIHSHGADAMRYTLTQMATQTQDVRLPVDLVCPHCKETFHPKEFTDKAGYTVAMPTQTCPKCNKKMTSPYGAATGVAKPTADAPLARTTSSKFDLGRNFCNKLWNATRFALTYLNAPNAHGLLSVGDGGVSSIDVKDLALPDRWVIARLHRTLHIVEDALADYQFAAYAEAMYDFIWRDFCDWYLEVIKPTVKDDPNQQQVLRTVLNAAVRMLHPICPFVTEALWPHIYQTGPAGIEGVKLPSSDNELLTVAPWPSIKCSVEDKEAVKTFERLQALTSAIRNLRSERQVPPKKKITLHTTRAVQKLLDESPTMVETLAGLESVELLTENRPTGSIPFAFEGEEHLLSGLVDEVDVDAERTRLTKLIEEKSKAVAALNGRLSNEAYVAKAPPALVEQSRAQLAEANSDLEAARRSLESLGMG